MDEAVLRIVVDDSGAPTVTPPLAASAPQPPQPPAAPATVPTPSSTQIQATPPLPLPSSSTTESLSAIQSHVQAMDDARRERVAQKQAAWYAANPPTSPPPTQTVLPPATTTPLEPPLQPGYVRIPPKAQELPTDKSSTSDLDKRIAELEYSEPEPDSAAARKLTELKEHRERGGTDIPEIPGKADFDPLEIAKERIKKEEERALVDAEYAKLKPPPPPQPPPPFNPLEIAKKRVKAEEERVLVEAEYAKLKPKSGLDTLVEVAESLRGTIGGTFGKVAGVALDITARLRDIRAKSQSATVPTGVATNAPKTASAATGATPAATGATEAAPAAEATTGGAMAAFAGAGPYVAIAAAGVVAIKVLTDALNKTADKYAEYNPAIAQAQAMAEIKGIMGDMRRAQQSGPELVEFIKAQANMQQKWEDIKIKILMAIAPSISAILDAVSQLLGIAQSNQEFEFQDPTEYILGNINKGEFNKETMEAIRGSI